MSAFKFVFLSLFSILFTFHTFAQKVSVQVYMDHLINDPRSDTIYYNFNRKLSWQDYLGKIPPSVPWGAMTASGFSFNSEMIEEGNQITISVGIYTFFTKHNSWKKPDVNSAYHLEHEQHHFDITRLGAQNLADQIKKAHFTAKNYKKLLNTIFDKVYEENMEWQHEYDKETQNSLDQPKQLEWNHRITAAIKKLQGNIALSDH